LSDLLVFPTVWRPPSPTLFPYTTLFRSAVREPLHHVQHYDCGHAVVAEPLPHLDEEQGDESQRPRSLASCVGRVVHGAPRCSLLGSSATSSTEWCGTRLMTQDKRCALRPRGANLLPRSSAGRRLERQCRP